MKRILKKVGKALLYVLMLLIAFIIIVLIWLKSASQGETEAIKDQRGNTIENSIAEVIKVPIGGIEQYIIIRGKSLDNPVLLMLHGGPGSPQAHLNLLHNKELEDHYIVVNWDQRGAGASYYDDIPEETMTIKQFVDDTYEVSNYLKDRFNKEKIVLLGHSWGSFLGMHTIFTYPDAYYAYVGIGQVSDQRKSEDLSYEWVLKMAKEANNEKALSDLTSIGAPVNGVYKDPLKGIQLQRKWVTEYGGAAYGKTSKDFFEVMLKPLFSFREYELKDKFNYVKGMQFTQTLIWSEMLNQQLVDVVDSVQVPIYILHGKHDYQTVYSLSKTYIDSLYAPKKEFITFENSSHLVPYNQEIDKFHNIMINKVRTEAFEK